MVRSRACDCVRTVFTKLARRRSRRALDTWPFDPPLTYGYFTFTNLHGPFTAYATPDFVNLAIQIIFDAPAFAG